MLKVRHRLRTPPGATGQVHSFVSTECVPELGLVIVSRLEFRDATY